MSLVRPLARSLARPLPHSLIKGGGDIIRSIFADGTDGFYFDFSKTDRLFQDLVETPADGAGENIYLGLESHSWGGLSVAGIVAAASEIITNGGFDSDTLWTKGTGWTIAAGVAAAAAVTTGQVLAHTSSGGEINKLYRISYDIASYTGGGTSPFIGVAGTARTAAGTGLTEMLRASATAVLSFVRRVSDFTGSIDNVSMKLIPGNHGLQATTSAQPKWQTGGLARFDGSDDNLLTTLVPGTAMTLMAKVKATAPVSAGVGVILGSRDASDTRSYIGINGLGASAGPSKLSAGVGINSSSVIYGGADVSGVIGVAALSYNGSTVKLYWNGAEIYSGAQSGSPTVTRAFALGGLNDNGTMSAFGASDLYHALAIKKALTAAQIAAITNLWGTT